jgi:hypothetical protein
VRAHFLYLALLSANPIAIPTAATPAMVHTPAPAAVDGAAAGVSVVAGVQAGAGPVGFGRLFTGSGSGAAAASPSRLPGENLLPGDMPSRASCAHAASANTNAHMHSTIEMARGTTQGSCLQSCNTKIVVAAVRE